MLEFILDGVTVTEPEGLRELRHRIYYNDGLNGYLEQFDGSVSFYGTEYTTLRNRFFADGCAVVPVEVRNGADSYLGNIFLNDAEWEPDKSKVTCEIVDRSFLSLIDNNKSIKAYVHVARSKNDIPITATVQTDLKFKAFDVSTNTDLPANRHGVRVYDALKTLIEFMSDGQISLLSDFFFPDDDPAENRPRIPTLITGRSIRTGEDDKFPFISFEELYTDLQKLYNLAFSIEEDGGQLFMRIEPSSYFTQQVNGLTIADASSLQQSSVKESLYARMKFGSAEEDERIFFPSGIDPPPLPFVQWSDEEYHLGGQCNNDVLLDLKLRTLITDTNSIMRCLPFGGGNPQSLVNPPDSSYDDDIFLVLFDGSNETIVSVNPIDTDLRYYNGRLRNQEVAERWGDGVPFPIFLFLGGNVVNDAEGVVLSNITATTHPTFPLFLEQWRVDNNIFTAYVALIEFPVSTPPNGYDPSLNLQTDVRFTNFRGTWYTAPLTDVYSMTAKINFDGAMEGFVIAQIRPSNPIATRLVGISNIFMATPAGFDFGWYNRTAEGSLTTVAAAGDEFYVICVEGGFAGGAAGAFPPVFKSGSSFEVFANGNTITKTYDPASNYLFKSSAQYPLPSDWWRQFRTQWHQRIQLTYNSGQAQGYVREISRNIYTGDADVEIVSKFADVTT
jgi:hypothetical protein